MVAKRFAEFLTERYVPEVGRSFPIEIDTASPDVTEEDESDSTDELGVAEGQHFAIEYRDAKGNLTRRRITVWAIRKSKSGMPSPYARCHERNAMRQFRIDRIQCCIDEDGVIHDTADFLADTFGMNAEVAELASNTAISGRDLIKSCVSEAVLLAAMMNADGKIREQEVAVASAFCLTLCEKRQGRMLQGNLESLSKYIDRMNPTHSAILDACDVFLSSSVDEKAAVLRAMRDVMDADGDRDKTEIKFLNEISRDLIGMDIM